MLSLRGPYGGRCYLNFSSMTSQDWVRPHQVCRWHQTEWCSCHTWRTGCHLEGPGQAGEVGLCELWGSTRPSAKFWIWIGVTHGTNTGWGMKGLKAFLLRRIWGYWGEKSWTWADNVHLQPRRPTVSWPASKAARPEGWRRWFCPSALLSQVPYLDSCIEPWSPRHKKNMELLERVQRRPQKWSEGWSTSAMRKGWESWGCWTWRREGCGETLLRPCNTQMRLTRKMETMTPP